MDTVIVKFKSSFMEAPPPKKNPHPPKKQTKNQQTQKTNQCTTHYQIPVT